MFPLFLLPPFSDLLCRWCISSACAVCSVQCTVCSVQCVVYSVLQCAVYRWCAFSAGGLQVCLPVISPAALLLLCCLSIHQSFPPLLSLSMRRRASALSSISLFSIAIGGGGRVEDNIEGSRKGERDNHHLCLWSTFTCKYAHCTLYMYIWNTFIYMGFT